MRLHKNPTLADSICDLRTRKIKTIFFTQINTLFDWKEICRLKDKDYSMGKSATGKPSYDGFCFLKYAYFKTGMD